MYFFKITNMLWSETNVAGDPIKKKKITNFYRWKN